MSRQKKSPPCGRRCDSSLEDRLSHFGLEGVEPATSRLAGVEGGDHCQPELREERSSVGLGLGLKLNPGDLGVHLNLLIVSGEDDVFVALHGDLSSHQ